MCIRDSQNTARKPIDQLRVEEAKQLMEENGIDINLSLIHISVVFDESVKLNGTSLWRSVDVDENCYASEYYGYFLSLIHILFLM